MKMNFSTKNYASKMFPALFLVAAICLVLLFSVAVKKANAIDDQEMRTVFAIADIADYGSQVFLKAYIVFGDQLILAETWQVPSRQGGAVGLAVDQANERLFMSFEQGSVVDDDDDFDDGQSTGGGTDTPSNIIDVFSARDGSYITQIVLPGTTNLAGMVVHQSRGHLYVVDRGDKDVFVFDVNANFTLIDHWILPTGQGAWGIDLHNDILYTTDTDPLYTHYVRWYDIDTHQELGSYDFAEEVTGIVVMADRQTPSNGPLIYTTSYDGFIGSYDKIQRYAIGAGAYTSAVVGKHTAGISANPELDIVYVSHAGTLFTDPLLKVIDVAGGSVLNSYAMPEGDSPTDVIASNIPFGGTVSKTLTSHPSGNIPMGQTASFEIEIENRSIYSLVMIPLEDIYDPTHFTFVSATPTPDNTTNGDIVWNDLTTSLGNLPPSGVFTIYMDLMATDSCTVDLEGSNLAQVAGALDSFGNPMYAAGVADYLIECGCTVNADCDDGLWCNGAEICDVNGNCQSSAAPCEDDGLFCNGVEGCDEINDQCTNSGNPCPDDGVFCNGNETCNEGNDTCDHSGDPCTNDGLFCNGEESCNETADICDTTVPCPEDGLFCNGDETCNEGNDTCGHAGDPCANDGQFCNGQESCNETADICDTTVPCPDDGVFCNGVEGCDEAADTCLPGADPCSDDGLFCNGDESCDEASSSCVHSGEPCADDGLYCNGTEACDEAAKSCVSTGDPCSDDDKYCNGDEYCNEDNHACLHTGDPCPPGEYCIEDKDICSASPDDSGDDDDEDDSGKDLWPKGEVTGGCCGC